MFERSQRLWVLGLTAGCLAVCAVGAGQAGGEGLTAEAALEKEYEAWDKSQLGRTEFRGVWAGTLPQPKHLRGNVVLLAYSDFLSQACRAATPELASLAAQCRNKGLVVIGVLVPPEKKDKKTGKVLAEARKRMPFTVVTGATVPQAAAVETTPHLVLFDDEGKVTFEGPLSRKVMPVLKEALAGRPHPLLGKREYTRLAGAAALVKTGRLGAAHKQCSDKRDAPGQTGEEARCILARLDRLAEGMFKEADDFALSPTERITALQGIRKIFSGSAQGDSAAEKLKSWKTEETLRNELRAEREFEIIRRAAEPLGKRPGDQAKRKLWESRHAGALRALRTRAAMMRKKYPFTWGLRKAEEMVAKLTPL